MRSLRPAIPLLPALLVAVAASAGCGDTSLREAYAGYKSGVEPLLERERDLGRRIEGFLGTGDPAVMPDYYRLLEGEARPFYTQLQLDVAALTPEREELAAAHEELIQFIRVRLEFVEIELRARESNRKAGGPGGVQDATVALNVAEDARIQYREMVRDDVPDPRLSDLFEIDKRFRVRYLMPLNEGRAEALDVQRHLQNVVIPRVDEMLAKKFDDSVEDEQLRKMLAAWRDWYVLMANVAESWEELQRVGIQTGAAVEEAREHHRRFLAHLEAVRAKI